MLDQLFNRISDSLMGYHLVYTTEWNPDIPYESNDENLDGRMGVYDYVVTRVYPDGRKVEDTREHSPSNVTVCRKIDGCSESITHETATYLHHSNEYWLEKEMLLCQSTDQLKLVANQLVHDGKAGIVATVENTFDNGYTSVWNYKVEQDGSLCVQKPWGNQARAYFNTIEDMVADFERYLGYGFQAT